MIARTAVDGPTLAVVVEQQVTDAVAAGQTVDVDRHPRVAVAALRLLQVAARPRPWRAVRVSHSECCRTRVTVHVYHHHININSTSITALLTL